jgi:hypothetical protein
MPASLVVFEFFYFIVANKNKISRINLARTAAKE